MTYVALETPIFLFFASPIVLKQLKNEMHLWTIKHLFRFCIACTLCIQFLGNFSLDKMVKSEVYRRTHVNNSYVIWLKTNTIKNQIGWFSDHVFNNFFFLTYHAELYIVLHNQIGIFQK